MAKKAAQKKSILEQVSTAQSIEPSTIETQPEEKNEAQKEAVKKDSAKQKKHDPKQLNTDSEPKKKKSKKPRLLRYVFIAFLILLIPTIIIGIAGLLTYGPVKRVVAKAEGIEVSARGVYDALKTQNLGLANEKLSQTKTMLDEIKSDYAKLSWYRYTPFRAYYSDAGHVLEAASAGMNAGSILLDTIEPYADVLGFSGEGTFTGGTAEERITKIVETLDKVTPSLDQVAGQLEVVQTELAAIDPDRYPYEVKGKLVSEWLLLAQQVSDGAVIAVTDVKPLLEVLPSVAGIDGDKKYLVLFQNDAELRPTGGFMTAYGILRVEKGKVHQEKSDDIYSLDDKFNSKIPAPAPILTYLDNVPNWYLRDMNLSPDFKVSMDTFMQYYKTLPDEPADEINGIVAMDTQVLTDLVAILGPIEVPGFGQFTAEIDERCDCPQVIYELEDYATRPRAYIRTDRKAFLAPMLQTLLLKAYGSPKEVWPKLFEVVINNVVEKHVLFYMFDEEAQLAAEQVNIAGRISEYDGDYLHINDSNLGGAKSNLFITEDIDYQISYQDGVSQNTLEVTYRNPAPASNCNLEAGKLCLNGIYRNWVRFYIPKGAELIESQGLEEGSVELTEEFDRTVVEGFFKFSPESQAKVKLVYKFNYQPDSQYKLLIQKQPGKKQPSYRVTYNQIDRQEFDLKTDKEVVFDL